MECFRNSVLEKYLSSRVQPGLGFEVTGHGEPKADYRLREELGVFEQSS